MGFFLLHQTGDVLVEVLLPGLLDVIWVHVDVVGRQLKVSVRDGPDPTLGSAGKGALLVVAGGGGDDLTVNIYVGGRQGLSSPRPHLDKSGVW